jgi:sugar diacid utilization regulator
MRWRQRMSEEKLVTLLQESLHLPTRTEAAKQLLVDTKEQKRGITLQIRLELHHSGTTTEMVLYLYQNGGRLRHLTIEVVDAHT